MTKHIPHTCVVEEVAGPRDICQAVLTAIFPSGVLPHLFERLPQSLPEDVDPKRLGSENNATKEEQQAQT